jgi:hypothetical protein
VHSPWIAVDLAADHVARARLLRRAHDVVLSGRGTPPVLREVIVRSWARCAAAGVDPDRPAPVVLDADQTAGRFAAHPLARVLSTVRRLAGSAAEDARHLLVLSDSDGMLLCAEGHPSMLEAAIGPHFLPGALYSEAVMGTNAVGTSLVLDHPVQVFSAEHFNRLLHGWCSSAAPIHDPASGDTLGAVDLSGSFRTAHPHTLSLVSAVARAAEAQLSRDRERREADLIARYVDRLSAAGRRTSARVAGDGRVLLASPRCWLGRHVDVPDQVGRVAMSDGTRAIVEPIGDGARIVWGVRPRARRIPRRVLRLRALGDEPPVILLDGRPLRLSARHTELLVALALRPDGLSADALARAMYGRDAKRVTVRAEVARLRRTVADLVLAQPYRLGADVRADFLEIERVLAHGDVDAAVDLHRGPLLPSSSAPAIVTARAAIEAALATAVGARGADERCPRGRSVGRRHRLSGRRAGDTGGADRLAGGGTGWREASPRNLLQPLADRRPGAETLGC